MKKLTKEEAEKVPLKGPGNSSYLFNTLINMKAGESILIEPKDWREKRNPCYKVHYVMRTRSGRKFTCGAAADGSGWLVTRTG